ncbi:MAG: glycosyltransferase family 4 protein, partial [Anaerolineales bacterium]
MRILFLSNWYPYPPDNGSKARIFNLLRGLAREHEVALISFAESGRDVISNELDDLCTSIQVIARREFRPASPASARALFGDVPRAVVHTYAPEMAVAIEAEIESSDYDLIIASQWITASYAQSFGGKRALLEELELGSFESKVSNATGPIQRLRHRLPLIKMRQYVRSILPSFAACTVVSQREAEFVRRAANEYDSIEIIPNFVDISSYGVRHKSREEPTLIFAGSLTYFANRDGMGWFLDEAFPLIRKEIPNATLLITGKSPKNSLEKLPGVSLTGYVADVRPLVGSAHVSIAPIRLGGGTRLKILESMALRTPVVSTSKGTEGLAIKNGEHALIADDPHQFATSVIRLLRDPRKQKRISDSAFELAK